MRWGRPSDGVGTRRHSRCSSRPQTSTGAFSPATGLHVGLIPSRPASRGDRVPHRTSTRRPIPMATLVRHIMTEEPKTLSAFDVGGRRRGHDGELRRRLDPGARRRRCARRHRDRSRHRDQGGGRQDATPTRFASAMSPPQVTVEVTPDTEIADANQLMAEHRVRRLPVIKDGALVGIVSLGDIAVALASKRTVGRDPRGRLDLREHDVPQRRTRPGHARARRGRTATAPKTDAEGGHR